MKLKKAIICAIVLFVAFAVCVFALKTVFPLKYSDPIDRYADRFDLSEELLMGVIYAESGFDKTAHSGKAYGLMQITEETAKWIAEKLDRDYYEGMLEEPELNIEMGSYYLSYLIGYYKNTETALAAYNAGMGNVSRWLGDKNYSDDGIRLREIPYGETKRYVERVKKLRTIYEILY